MDACCLHKSLIFGITSKQAIKHIYVKYLSKIPSKNDSISHLISLTARNPASSMQLPFSIHTYLQSWRELFSFPLVNKSVLHVCDSGCTRILMNWNSWQLQNWNSHCSQTWISSLHYLCLAFIESGSVWVCVTSASLGYWQFMKLIYV